MPNIAVWWSWRLAQAVVAEAEQRHQINIRSMFLATPEVFAITFVPPATTCVFGVRLDQAELERIGSRLSGSSVEEVAFDIVVVAAGEPRLDEHHRAGEDRVHWLALTEWAE